jgi:mevalonate kinase
MNPVTADACAKIILCGEHSVVYQRPAIALPLPRLRTTASIRPHSRRFVIHALDIRHVVYLPRTPIESMARPHPLALIAHLTFKHLKIQPPRAVLTIQSNIPVGSNLGSGAAVSISVVRALAAYVGLPMPAEDASALAFAVEKLHHGTPSGIDNTVIAHERPVWFVKGEPPQPFELREPLPLVIGDTGESTPTRVPVGDVRELHLREPDRINALFDAISTQVQAVRSALATHDLAALGEALDANHALLRQLSVSSPRLDALCQAARDAGALGAKMSGGGRGGNMLALARDPEQVPVIADALRAAGARRVFLG